MPCALQEKRLAKKAEMERFVNEHEADWTPQTEEQWKRINGEYDAILAEVTAADDQIQKRAAVDAAKARMAEIDSYTSKAAARAGRDAGELNDRAEIPEYDESDPADTGEQRFKSHLQNQQKALEQQMLAIRGWLKVSASQSPSEAERKAARSLKVALSGQAMPIDLLPTQKFRDVQGAGYYANGRYQNTLTTLTGSSGGFTIGEVFLRDLESAMLYYGPMLQSSQVIRTESGEDMHWPTAIDTSNTGVMLGESTIITNADPTFGRTTWRAFKFTSKQILIPIELLEDTIINLESELSRMLGERLGRIMNTKFTVGVGGIEPRGIITAASLGVTAASATAITFDEIISLEHSIDISRRSRPGVGYMFHDNILLAIRKLKDGDSRYLWQAGAAPGGGESVTGGRAGVADTLNARPFWVNNDMASAITTTQKTILFGELTQYKVRQVRDTRLIRLNERYADYDQVAFQAFTRCDGNLLNAGDNPVKYLQQA